MFVRLVRNLRSRRESGVFGVNTSGAIRLKDLIPTRLQLEHDGMRFSCLSKVSQPHLPGKITLLTKMIMVGHDISEFMKFRNLEGREMIVW